MAQAKTKTTKTTATKTVKAKAASKPTTTVTEGDTLTVKLPPRCTIARTQRAKPTAKMLRKISKINAHPGSKCRIKRYANYKVGMTLQHCKETEGLDPLDSMSPDSLDRERVGVPDPRETAP